MDFTRILFCKDTNVTCCPYHVCVCPLIRPHDIGIARSLFLVLHLFVFAANCKFVFSACLGLLLSVF